MNIKHATLIALCGNAAVAAINLLSLLFGLRFRPLGPFGLFVVYIMTEWVGPLVGPCTLVVFLFILYRKQP